MSVYCQLCDEELPDEYNGEMNEGTVCPHCGKHLRRHYKLHTEGAIFKLTGGIVNLTVTTYSENLLKEVADLIDREKFTLAVIVAHMACEIIVERALSREFRSKGLEHLEAAVTNLLPSKSIANDKVRNLYDTVTGGNVYNDLQAIWQDVKALATLRNKSVHGGILCDEAQASKAFETATELVKYFKE